MTIPARVFALVACLTAVAEFTAVAETPPAIVQFRSLAVHMHRQRLAGDWKGFRDGAQAMAVFLNGSPDALLDLARAKVNSNDVTGTLGDLEAIAAMGQSRPIVGTLPDFDRLHGMPGFERVLREMKFATTPTSTAHESFRISDPGLLPEDIDYDARTRRYLFTSVLEHKVVSLDRTGRLTTIATSANHWPMLALKIDTQRRIVWATEVALAGFASVPKRDWGRSALIAYDCDSGRLLRRIEAPRPSALGDMTIAPNGTLLISDGDSGGVYELSPGGRHLDAVGGGNFISPQTPAFIPGTDEALVPDYVRGIAVLNLHTKRARWLPMEHRYALEGIDGMYLYDHTVVAVENGTVPERVILFTLDAEYAHVRSQHVIERATPQLDPTHGVVRGNTFFYIANAGWDSIDDRGVVKHGSALTPAKVMRATL